MATYFEKLQDPRWQKKRLEAMQDKEFTCELCGDSQSMLQVHHKEYFKGADPWDYYTEQLAVLCKTCHKNYHDQHDALKAISSFLSLDGKFNRNEVAMVIFGYLGSSYEHALEMTLIEDFPAHKIHHEAGLAANEYMEKRVNNAK